MSLVPPNHNSRLRHRNGCRVFAAAVADVGRSTVGLSTAKAEPLVDQRQAIVLDPPERAFVLKEMRGFLASVEGIVAALASDKVADAQEAARASGMGVMRSMPPNLRPKLPMEFKKMGHMTHQSFDKLADEAATLGDKAVVLKQLETILNTCNTCHASYRLSETLGN